MTSPTVITVDRQTDEDLAKETLRIRRIRTACDELAEAHGHLPSSGRQRPISLASVKRRLFQGALNDFVQAADPDAFVETLLAEVRKDIEELGGTAQG